MLQSKFAAKYRFYGDYDHMIIINLLYSLFDLILLKYATKIK